MIRPYPAYSMRARSVAPPVNAVAPVLSGTVTLGGTLAIAAGTWSGAPTLLYTLRRDGIAVGALTNVSEAVIEAYALLAADIGPALDVVETATNGGGSASATSNSLTYSITADLGAILTKYHRGDLGVTDVGGFASVWADQSGAGNNSTAAVGLRPAISTLNGRTALDFDGVNDVMITATALSAMIAPAAFHTIVIASPDAVNTNAADGYSNDSVLCDTSAYWYPHNYRNNAGVYTGTNGYWNAGTRIVNPAMTLAAAMVETKLTGGVLSSRVAAGAFATLAGLPVVGSSANPVQIGGRSAGGTYFDGKIAFIVVCNAEMSATQVANVRALGSHLYGVVS